jgi:hypothetical protein
MQHLDTPPIFFRKVILSFSLHKEAPYTLPVLKCLYLQLGAFFKEKFEDTNG